MRRETAVRISVNSELHAMTLECMGGSFVLLRRTHVHDWAECRPDLTYTNPFRLDEARTTITVAGRGLICTIRQSFPANMQNHMNANMTCQVIGLLLWLRFADAITSLVSFVRHIGI